MTVQSKISRRTDRFAMEAPARIKTFGATKPEKVTLSDLSAVGCQLSPAHSMTTGARLLVKISGLDYRPATVLWKRQDRVGIEFEKPLHPRSVQDYARHHAN